jgi:broad specificity phosphatase PhoE
VGQSTSGTRFTGLTKRGNDQAKWIAAFFPRAPSLIITSDYKRAQQTAQPTKDRFRDVPHDEWPVHEFTYLSRFHTLFMSTQDRKPLVDSFWAHCDPFYIDGKGAESFAQFLTRVHNVLEQLCTREEEFIAVFTHGHFMRAVWWLLHNAPTRLDGDGMKYFRNLLTTFPIPNGGILPAAFLPRNETWMGNIMIPRCIQENEEWPLETSLTSQNE